MRPPKYLAKKLFRQWQDPNLRAERLLNKKAWPLLLRIRRPSPSDVMMKLSDVRSHLNDWKKVRIGEVQWDEVQYRGVRDPLKVPVFWKIDRPEEWVLATQNHDVKNEFKKISKIIDSVDKIFAPLLIRRFYLIAEKSEDEIIKSCELALLLNPGCAQGAPLRTLSHGVDSKFYERNRKLLVSLLDVLFNNLVSEQGLETFLGAIDESDHWILLTDLSRKLLLFQQLRVRGSDLAKTPLPAENILIVENESCLHHLPELEDTIAILGAGLDLSWMEGGWLDDKKIAYWGDIDTWGLTMLARAKARRPFLTALLMDETLYDKYREQSAVKEPRVASKTPPEHLNQQERYLYLRLVSEAQGRLEQEFIPKDTVKKEVLKWGQSCSTKR